MPGLSDFRSLHVINCEVINVIFSAFIGCRRGSRWHTATRRRWICQPDSNKKQLRHKLFLNNWHLCAYTPLITPLATHMSIAVYVGVYGLGKAKNTSHCLLMLLQCFFKNTEFILKMWKSTFWMVVCRLHIVCPVSICTWLLLDAYGKSAAGSNEQ